MRRVTTTIVILAVLASVAIGLLIGRLAGGGNSKEPSRPAATATVTATRPALSAVAGTPSPPARPATPAPSPVAATPEPATPTAPAATPASSPTAPAAPTPTKPPLAAMPTTSALPPPPPVTSVSAIPLAARGPATELIAMARPITGAWDDGTGGPCSPSPNSTTSISRTCP